MTDRAKLHEAIPATRLFATRLVTFAAVVAVVGCGSVKRSGSGDAGRGGGGDGASDSPSPSDGGGDVGSTGTDAHPGSDAAVDGPPSGAVTCSSPSTGFQNNGGSCSCGTWRWAVKTGTDNDVGKINLVPQVTTIGALTSIATSAGGYCNRNAPTETNVYVLRDVDLKFEALEADCDYHIIASDPMTGQTMVTEVPFPGCVGHNSCASGMPVYCDITHARAAVDAKNPSQTYGSMGTGTIVGVGFFDTDELMNHPGPSGEAPNGIELHPILGICFGAGCDPLAGY
jgi:hypothetical protein